MKKIQLLTVVALLTTTALNTKAQGFLKKMADKANAAANPKVETKKGPGLELIKPYAKDFNDDLGIGGNYLMSDTLWLNDDLSRGTVYEEKKLNANNNFYYTTSVKIEFAREHEDKVVNALNFYSNEKSKPYYALTMDEKMKKNSNIIYFKGSQNYTVLEPGVIVRTEMTPRALGIMDQQVVTVYAKDPAKLAMYDKETALAKWQQIMMAGEKEKVKAEKAKWAANDVYKKMVGKIGFVKHYNNTGWAYNKIDETMETFISSFDFDKKAYWRAYFDMPPNTLCPNGCDQNIIYEMEGVKVSTLELRKSSAAWSNKLGSKRPPDDRFLSACPTLFDYNPVSLSDYAFMYLIYQSKAKFTGDKSFKIKMTITNNNAGVDKDVVATGQINLEYKAAQKPTLDKIIELVDKVENQ